MKKQRSCRMMNGSEAKYIIVVDGHGWADRTAVHDGVRILLFHATLHEDWVSNQLIPNEHYIKVKPDLSDLIEKLEWANKNDSEAKRIAQNGKEFAHKNLRRNQVRVYNGMLFMHYQTLFE